MKLSKAEAIEKLEESIKQIDLLKQSEGFSPAFEKWKRDTEIAIENIFSAQSRNIKDFTKISYSLMIATTNTPESAWTNAYRGGLEHARAILRSMIDEIKNYWPSEVTLATDVRSLAAKGCQQAPKLGRAFRIWALLFR